MEKEYSEEFDRLRRNRMAASFHKYGPARKNYGEGRVDALATAELCIEAFKRDRNLEHLVDAGRCRKTRKRSNPTCSMTAK